MYCKECEKNKDEYVEMDRQEFGNTDPDARYDTIYFVCPSCNYEVEDTQEPDWDAEYERQKDIDLGL